MPLSLQRRAAFLIAVVLAELLTACGLLSLGVATQTVQRARFFRNGSPRSGSDWV
jgi:hypothetical protein